MVIILFRLTRELSRVSEARQIVVGITVLNDLALRVGSVALEIAFRGGRYIVRSAYNLSDQQLQALISANLA
jgi:hypothetical protein